MDVTIEVNFDDLARDLADMPRRIVEGCFADALAAGAAPVEDAIRQRTPEAAGDPTSAKKYGRLVDVLSTDIAVDAQALEGTADIGFDDHGPGYIARFLEYGHRSGHGKFTPAHPVVRPAAAASEDAAVDAFVESLTDQI
jgi:hypothetical protein